MGTTSGSASSGVLGEVGGGASSRIINRINGSMQEHLRAVWGQQLPLIYATTAFLSVGRWLCVYTFPALFKMHKTRSDCGNPMRSFMGFLGFLDRKVENSLILVSAFWSIVCSILCSSTKVFLQYFPVEVSAECLETDNHGRTLFCYSNSSLPVDCANFSVTELRELQFQCYTGLGIAVAATLGLAKVAIVGVTIIVKVTEEPSIILHC